MMFRRIRKDEKGVAAIEMAFALPVLIVIIWTFIQLAQVYRALAGIQQALGEGARYATLCLNPTTTGCTIPTPEDVQSHVQSAVYGIGPGDFQTPLPKLITDPVDGGKYYDLKVSYTQHTHFIIIEGPDISVQRNKRVWVATT
jgi:Flp pilus assembly pilin Flp